MIRHGRWCEVGAELGMSGGGRVHVAAVADWLPDDEMSSAALREVLGSAYDRYLETTSRTTRERLLASRLMLRAAVADSLGCADREIRLHTEPGRPPRAQRYGVRAPVGISLSHTATAVAVAVATDGTVGVDIEPCDRPIYSRTFAAAVGHPRELTDLARLEPDGRNAALVAVWTMKEAVLKARGVGLTVDPRQVCVGLPARGAAATIRDIAGPDGHRTRIATTTHRGLRISTARQRVQHA